ncbi:nucleotidyltransferase family protein [Gaetbulibacter aquiaggeris]|uniref:Nucleotidyltransferase family protein n=1 Tax=Gaetbulibacter aquiaggeris TaxID=1735373 RepID=A0ABW7MUP7_9FLAO
MSKLAVLILAAGNSSRMGVSKQLLKWKYTNLLQHTINTVNEVNSENIVVLGANYSKIRSQIEDKNTHILCNKNWQKGLGSTISFGINYINNSLPHIDNVLIMLADQPLINADFLNQMIETQKLYQNKIICTLYQNEKLGVPAIFNNSFFEELLQLNNDMGAKNILQKYSDRILSVDGENLISDIDTIEDYEILYREHH